MFGNMKKHKQYFLEMPYNLHIKCMAIFEHHSIGIRNVIAQSSAYNALAVQWNLSDADMNCLSLKEPLGITEGMTWNMAKQGMSCLMASENESFRP